MYFTGIIHDRQTDRSEQFCIGRETINWFYNGQWNKWPNFGPRLHWNEHGTFFVNDRTQRHRKRRYWRHVYLWEWNACGRELELQRRFIKHAAHLATRIRKAAILKFNQDAGTRFQRMIISGLPKRQIRVDAQTKRQKKKPSLLMHLKSSLCGRGLSTLRPD